MHVSQFDLTVHRSGTGDRIALVGELDLATAAAVEKAVAVLCKRGPRSVAIDLRDVTFVDSSGIHVIFQAHRLCAEHGCDFALIPSRAPLVLKLWDVAGLSGLLPWQEEDDEEAVPVAGL